MTTATLPRWDMTVVYPSLDSPAFQADFAAIGDQIAALVVLFDQHQVAKRDPAPLTDADVAAFDAVASAYSDLLERLGVIRSYIYSFVATDSRDTTAQAAQSALQTRSVTLRKLGSRFTAWIGSLDVEALIARSALAAAHAYLLRRTQTYARHQMAPDLEALVSELQPTGGSAWERLHSTVTSQIAVTLTLDGRDQTLPMSAVRNLAFEADRDVRRRAYEAELAAWERHAVPLAAAMNSIKGEVNTLAARRGWESPLAAALFDNSIDQATLDAMMTAAHESFPDFRRYLRAKATALGLDALAWYDLFAPVGDSARSWRYDEATDFIVEQFGSFSDRLRAFAARSFAEQWIDAEPRPGKVDGAFCMALRKDESRILMNYSNKFKSVMTLAHELGHGYHNTNFATKPYLNRSAPMTLAETASIFCETIVRHAVMRDADPAERLLILDAALENACQVVVDITSRFLFERGVFARRNERELSIAELNDLMLDAQRQTYGDGLDPAVLHPYMWAVKGHYYSAGRSFYNFPYMFGLLFGLGLYTQFEQDPATFRARYDNLLASTGEADAATLAAQLGVNIRDTAFWRSSLDLVRHDVDQFEQLVASQRA